jgi:hypothetical protein
MKKAILATILLLTATKVAECTYVSFRWSGGPVPIRAYSNGGTTSLPAGSTLLTFLSSDSTISWTPNWSDGSDGGNYGATGNDVFLQSISCGPVGGYNTSTMLESSSPHANWYAYFVLVDYSYASFGGTLPNGSDYALLGSTFQVTGFETPAGQFQTFSPATTLTTSSHISIVPEPTTMTLLACGMGVLVMRRRRKQE